MKASGLETKLTPTPLRRAEQGKVQDLETEGKRELNMQNYPPLTQPHTPKLSKVDPTDSYSLQVANGVRRENTPYLN
jgi:hypothetical protein